MFKGGNPYGKATTTISQYIKIQEVQRGKETLSDHVFMNSKNLPMKPYSSKIEVNVNLKNNVSS
jgi:hypothetical protein